MPTNDDGTAVRPAVVLAVVGLIALVALASQLLLGGQTQKILSTVGSAVNTPVGAPAQPTTPSVGDTTAGSDAVPAQAVVDVSRPDLFVIRTGTIDLQVLDVVRAVGDAGREVDAVGGYVSASEQGGDGSGLTAAVTYRIPVAAWDGVVTGLRALATKVVSAETHTEDVTAQVVDLNARIANLQVTEGALQGIMAKATNTADVLGVQAELTKVRGQIEEATAQRQRLKDQAAFSTLTATFRLKPIPAVITTGSQFDPLGEIDRATARLVHVVQRALTAGIWFAIVWLPILIVLGLVVGGVVTLAVRARRMAERPEAATSGRT